MKKKKNNEFKAVPPYAQIEQKLVDSEGFKGLKAHTKWLYVEFRLRYRGNNSRDITLTENEAKRIMNLRTFRADYRKLIEPGSVFMNGKGNRNLFGLPLCTRGISKLHS